MTYVLVQLKVRDYEEWRPHFDEMAELRKANGRISELVLRNSADPNEVVLLFEWDDLEKARKYKDSDVLRKKIKESGVEEMNVVFLEEAEERVGV